MQAFPQGPFLSRHTTRLRVDALISYAESIGVGTSNAAIAQWLEVGEASITRLVSERSKVRQRPGQGFISALAKKLPDDVPLSRFLDFGYAEAQS